MVTRRIPDPKIGGSIPSGVTSFLKKKNTTSTRFELARAEPSRFLIYLLNHSDTTSQHTSKKSVRGPLDLQSNALPTELSQQRKKRSTATRFELARAEPSRFRIYLLNHSDTLPRQKMFPRRDLNPGLAGESRIS